MAQRTYHIDLINSTNDKVLLRRYRNNLMCYVSRELATHPELAISTYQPALDLVQSKLETLGVKRSPREVSSPIPSKPKDWEAEAMEWKRIAEGYREELEASKQRKKGLEEKLLKEKNMGIEWNDKIEKLSEKIRLAMEDYDRDMEIKEEEIQELKRKHARVLEKRDLEAKKKEEALYETIKELEGEIERLREEGEDRKSPQPGFQAGIPR